MKYGYRILPHASAHDPAQHIVNLAENGRIRSHFHRHHQFVLVEYLGTSGSIRHQRGIVRLHPSAVAYLPCRIRRTYGGVNISPGRCPEKYVGPRIILQERHEFPQGAAIAGIIRDYIVRKGFRSEQKKRACRSTVTPYVRQGFLRHGQEQCILLFLGHSLELVVRIYVRLDNKHFQRILLLFIRRIYQMRYCKRCRKYDEAACHGCRFRLSVESHGPSPVGQGHEQSEHREIRKPYPERPAQSPRIFIPLYGLYASGKGIAQHKPRPGDIHVEIGPLPGYPHNHQENIGQCACKVFLAEPERREDDGHLESIGEDCEKSAADSGIAHPERRDGVPQDE